MRSILELLALCTLPIIYIALMALLMVGSIAAVELAHCFFMECYL